MRAPQHLDGPNVLGAGGAVPVTLATFPLLAGLPPVRRYPTPSTKIIGASGVGGAHFARDLGMTATPDGDNADQQSPPPAT
jgi:hypothetical protein